MSARLWKAPDTPEATDDDGERDYGPYHRKRDFRAISGALDSGEEVQQDENRIDCENQSNQNERFSLDVHETDRAELSSAGRMASTVVPCPVTVRR